MQGSLYQSCGTVSGSKVPCVILICAALQIEVHPRYQQTSLRGFCAQHGIAVVAYASLGCGSLLGHETVLRLSHRLGRTPAQVLFMPQWLPCYIMFVLTCQHVSWEAPWAGIAAQAHC